MGGALVLVVSCAPGALTPPPPKAPLSRQAEKKPPKRAQKRTGKITFPEFVPRKLSLVKGERLVYAVRWVGIRAGEATMTVAEVSEGRARIRVTARSTRFVDAFYKVRDRAWCAIDTELGCSLGFFQKKHEGSYRAEEEVSVDYEKMVARLKYRRPERKERTRVLRLPSRTQDAISCLYVIRACRLEVGKEVRMTLTQSGRNWLLRLTPEKVEKLRLRKLGRFRAWRMKPEARFPGLFAHKGDMTAWVDVETGTVLKMLVDIPVGWITITLVRAENWPPAPSSKALASQGASQARAGSEPGQEPP